MPENSFAQSVHQTFFMDISQDKDNKNNIKMLCESICYNHLFWFTLQFIILIVSNKIHHAPQPSSCSSYKIFHEDKSVHQWEFNWHRLCNDQLLQISLRNWIGNFVIYNWQLINVKQYMKHRAGKYMPLLVISEGNTTYLSKQPKIAKQIDDDNSIFMVFYTSTRNMWAWTCCWEYIKYNTDS